MKQSISKLHTQLRPQHINFRSINQRWKDEASSERNYISLLIPGFVWDKIVMNHDITDNSEVFCELAERVILDDLPREFHHATLYFNPPSIIVPNILWIFPMPSRDNFGNNCFRQINAFINAQNKVAF
jgi:hypothetical protein